MGGPVRQVPPPHKEGLTHGDTPRQGAEAWILPPCGASAGGGDAGTQKDGALVATAGAWLSRGSRPSLSGSRIYVRLPWNGCACRRRPGGTLMALLQSGGRYPCKNQSIWRTQKGRFQKNLAHSETHFRESGLPWQSPGKADGRKKIRLPGQCPREPSAIVGVQKRGRLEAKKHLKYTISQEKQGRL